MARNTSSTDLPIRLLGGPRLSASRLIEVSSPLVNWAYLFVPRGPHRILGSEELADFFWLNDRPSARPPTGATTY